MGNKVLEAFDRITLHTEYDNDGTFDCLVFEDSCEIVEQALQELDDIKNAKPSEALKDLEVIGSVCPEEDVSAKEIFYEEYDTIKQYILKAQQQEKVLNIIKEKNIEISEFKNHYFNDYDDYKTKMNIRYSQYGEIEWDNKSYIDYIKLLTQEEFDTLKRWANNDRFRE